MLKAILLFSLLSATVQANPCTEADFAQSNKPLSQEQKSFLMKLDAMGNDADHLWVSIKREGPNGEINQCMQLKVCGSLYTCTGDFDSFFNGILYVEHSKEKFRHVFRSSTSLNDRIVILREKLENTSGSIKKLRKTNHQPSKGVDENPSDQTEANSKSNSSGI